MIRRMFGVVLALFTSLAVPQASAEDAEPGAAALVLDVTISCFGCGVAGGSIAGTVVAGQGPFRTGAAVTGGFTVDAPAGPSCSIESSAFGTLTTSDGYTAEISWNVTGAATAMRIVGYGSGTGTFTIDAPQGNPCGGPVTATMRVSARRAFDPAALLGGSSPWGGITIRTVNASGGVELFTSGMFQSGFQCGWAPSTTELVAYCEARTRLPLWPCTRILALSEVYPSRNGSVVSPSNWGEVATTAVCRGGLNPSATTGDASGSNPVTFATSGTGGQGFYRFECRARRSSWQWNKPPKSPFRSTCQTFAQ